MIPLHESPLTWTVRVQAAVLAVAYCLPLSGSALAAAGDNHSVVFSTYLGGGSDEQIRDVKIDENDNIIITGGTPSADFVTTPGAFDTTPNGDYDVFVVKLDGNGSLLWSTLIGGPGYDRAYAVETDTAGNIYVAGRAGPGFPTTSGVLQKTFAGDVNPISLYGPTDGFVCKLNPDGVLLFCTYFGASDRGIVRDLDLDPAGNIYLAAAQGLGRFPPSIENAFLNGPKGSQDAVVAKLSGDGTQVLWARYLGGSDYESGENSIRVDGDGNPVMLFMTDSTDIPATGGFDSQYAGNTDLYLSKLDGNGSVLWGTYLGGASNEETETHNLVVDPAGNVFVSAATWSADSGFALSPGTQVNRYAAGTGTQEIFAAKLAPDGSRLLALTFIGGQGDERPEGVGMDRMGNVYLTGRTTSADFPVTADAAQALLLNGDAIVVKLDNDLVRVYASFLGGSGSEQGRAIDVDDRQGNTVIGGVTASDDWPTLNGLQIARAGNDDGFVVKIAGILEDSSANGGGDDVPPTEDATNTADDNTPSLDGTTSTGSADVAASTGGGCVMNRESHNGLLLPFLLLAGIAHLVRARCRDSHRQCPLQVRRVAFLAKFRRYQDE